MTNCLLYARVSTDKQAQRDLSIPAQLDAMREYAKKRKWRIIGEYIDEGKSAKTADRPELKRLLDRCKQEKGIVDVVVIHKIDRLARNVTDHAMIKVLLKRQGIRLVSVVENIEDTISGQLLENIMASIAEFYSANLAEEVRKGRISKLKKGGWPQACPIGYKSIKREDGKTIAIEDLITSGLVKECFELYATGRYSLRELSKKMYQRGLKTRFGKKYSSENIKNLLKRKFYIGIMEWNGKEYLGKHVPIVPQELFERVQHILTIRHVNNEKKSKYSFLLRGIAYCRNCKKKLTAEKHPRGNYYRCLDDINKEKCSEPYIPVELLDTQLEILYEKLQPPVTLLKLIKEELLRIVEMKKKRARQESETLERTIQENEAKQLRAADQLMSRNISPEVYKKLAQGYTAKIQEAKRRLARLEDGYEMKLDFMDKCMVLATSLSNLHHRFNHIQKKKLARAVFKKIFVQNREIVEVHCTPPFEFLLQDKLKILFKDHPVRGSEHTIFEQLNDFEGSQDFVLIRGIFGEAFVSGNLRRFKNVSPAKIRNQYSDADQKISCYENTI